MPGQNPNNNFRNNYKGLPELIRLRAEIDKIDNKIVSLINKRAKIAKKIYEIKAKNNFEIFDVEREHEKIIQLSSQAELFPKSSMEQVFLEILSGTRKLGGEIKVGYLGPEGSFSHESALRIFGSASSFTPLKGIDEVFKSVAENKVDYGVIPLENSRDGLVGETLDSLIEYTTKIIYEVSLEVSFAFLSKQKSFDNIKRIYSHPKAVAQCSRWIKEKFGNTVEIVYTNSTSEGANKAAEDEFAGAIASEKMAKILGLNVLERQIQDFWGGRTDFIVITSKNNIHCKFSGHDVRVALCFSVNDEPGALHRALTPFAKYKINMKKIHSRPDKHTSRYNFFVEAQLSNIKNFELAIQKVKKISTFFKEFGRFYHRDIS